MADGINMMEWFVVASLGADLYLNKHYTPICAHASLYVFK